MSSSPKSGSAVLPAPLRPPDRDRSEEGVGPRATASSLTERARWAPVVLAALGAAIYLVAAPRTGDLAAHTFRTELFGREGLTLWNGHWFSGHNTPAYSVLFPPLGWLAGPMWVGAAAAVVAAALFEPLARRHFGADAWWGSLWFGGATASVLFTDRLPFMLGVAIGLASLLALQRRRVGVAGVLAAACSLASPVAGLFLALAGVAHGLAALRPSPGPARGARPPGRWRPGATVALAAMAPPVLLSAAFAGGGYEPFGFGAFWRVALFAGICLAAIPRGERVLRLGALLYGVATLAAFLVETPMGTNAVRLGALFGGPLLACALVGARGWRGSPALLAAVLLPLAIWQWDAPVRETVRAAEDPSTEPAYYAPLLGFLGRAGGNTGRVEIPLTLTHWEVAEVARRFPIARGWERQIDRERNDVLYDPGLDDAAYEDWLVANGVRFVALPAAGLDPRSERERQLVARDPAYLALRWKSPDWTVYEVTRPSPIVAPDAGADIRLAELGSDQLALDVRTPGSALVRVHWSPYWRVENGCVERDGDWTRVTVERPGQVEMAIAFAPSRLVSHGRRCG